MGTTGPASTNPDDRPAPMASTCRSSPSATWCGRRRCCSTASASRRCSRVAGGSMGGMQVLQWAATYPDRVFSAPADRHRRPPFLAEHRLPRGRPPGGDGRSGLARRPLSRRRHASPRKGLAVARMAAHITYLSDEALHRKFGRNLQDRDKPTFGFDADFQIESYLRHQGIDLRRPLRRQLLSLPDPGDGLFRPRRRPWRPARQRLQGHARRASASSPSPPTGCSRRSRTRRWCARSTPPAASVSFVEIETDRGHDAFLLDEPELFATIRGFLSSAGACPRHRGEAMNAPADRLATQRRPRRPPRHRRAGGAGHRACSTSAAATASCSRSSKRPAASTAAASRSARRASTNASPAACRSIQGDADTDLVDYPDDAFDFVILSARRCRRPTGPRHVVEQMLRIGHKAIVSFPNFGHWRVRGAARLHRPHAGDPQPALFLVRHAQHPLLHDPRLRRALRRDRRQDREGRSRSTRNGQRIGLNAPWWFWNLFGQQAVFLLSR